MTHKPESRSSVTEQPPKSIALPKSPYQHKEVDYIGFTEAAKNRLLESLLEQEETNRIAQTQGLAKDDDAMPKKGRNESDERSERNVEDGVGVMDVMDDVDEGSGDDKEASQSSAQEDLAGIRISLSVGSCGAFSYNIEFAYCGVNLSPNDDVIALDNGVRVFIDPSGSFVLFGLEMDYEDNDLEYGFVFRNPNEASRCKCGTSFYVNNNKASGSSESE